MTSGKGSTVNALHGTFFGEVQDEDRAMPGSLEIDYNSGAVMLACSSLTVGVALVGVFHTNCRIQHIVNRESIVEIARMLVDTGSEYTWVPGDILEALDVQREKKDLAFLMANGQQISRSVGYAIIHVQDHYTVDEVVFAEEGDLRLLGARTLEGLNLTVDAARKQLTAAGPLPAAAGKPVNEIGIP